MRTIDALWYGNIMPTEHSGQNNAQIKKLLALIVRNQEKLDKELQDDQRDVLSVLTDNYDAYVSLLEKEAFHEGFCLAAKLLMEALVQE